MTILVTGGAGFIGTNFVRYWRNRFPAEKLVVLDKLTYAGNKENLVDLMPDENFIFVQGDICNADLVAELLNEHKIQKIVHFAAESHVDRSIVASEAFIQTNIVGTHVLLEAARRYWLSERACVKEHRFHHISTDEVYGDIGVDCAASLENSTYMPSSPYSASKAAADHLVRAFHRTYQLNTSISICSNNFGPYQHPEKLIPLTISNFLLNKPIPVYGDGQQVRDWLSVDDHVRGIELILSDGKVGETYHIGANNEQRSIDVVKLIGATLENEFIENKELEKTYQGALACIQGKTQSLPSFVKDRPGHDKRYALNTSKIEAELGFKKQTNFEAGIKNTVRWYLANPHWWQ